MLFFNPIQNKRATIIAITGGSGSGKTSMIAALRREFDTNELSVVSQDDYFKPRSMQIKDPEGYLNFDIPSALELDAFERDLGLLTSGKDVERPVYSFNNELGDLPPIRICAAPVIVIEGLFLFAKPSLVEIIDYSIYVHAKGDLKLIRRIKRDLRGRQIISCGFQAIYFANEQDTKNEHRHSYVSEE